MSADVRAMSEQLAAEPSSLVFLPLAEQLLGRGDLLHASRVARKGAERHAHRADVHDLVARIALAQGDEVTAERAWRQSLAIAPEFGAANRGLGFLCYRQGRWAEAEGHLGEARRATPGDSALEAAWEALHVARREAAADAAAIDRARAAEHAREHPPLPTPGHIFDEVLGESGQVALLLDQDGLVVAGQYITAEGEDLGALIGAHLSGVGDEATRAMRHFGLGAWTRIALETEATSVVMAPTSGGVTLVASPRDVPLGMVRRTLEQCAGVARRWVGAGA